MSLGSNDSPAPRLVLQNNRVDMSWMDLVAWWTCTIVNTTPIRSRLLAIRTLHLPSDHKMVLEAGSGIEPPIDVTAATFFAWPLVPFWGTGHYRFSWYKCIFAVIAAD